MDEVASNIRPAPAPGPTSGVMNFPEPLRLLARRRRGGAGPGAGVPGGEMVASGGEVV